MPCSHRHRVSIWQALSCQQKRCEVLVWPTSFARWPSAVDGTATCFQRGAGRSWSGRCWAEGPSTARGRVAQWLAPSDFARVAYGLHLVTICRSRGASWSMPRCWAGSRHAMRLSCQVSSLLVVQQQVTSWSSAQRALDTLWQPPSDLILGWMVSRRRLRRISMEQGLFLAMSVAGRVALAMGLLHLLDRRAISPKQLQPFLGVLQWLGLRRRSKLSVYNSVFWCSPRSNTKSGRFPQAWQRLRLNFCWVCIGSLT